jgi:hypothetical protein
MKGIRNKLVEEMKDLSIIIKSSISRRYSYDDYFLIDNSFQRGFSMVNGNYYNQEFIVSAMNYLIGDKYEKVRDQTRQNNWEQINKNKYKIEHFQRLPD